ncbi:MAG: PAS domain S-box protein [Calditrichae bacterium]|nr:PAS domain S-box protein [Calditrichota bacterium]MCB9058752.1 PAS domain S-box protein [Calditrichia bacterium]
MSFLKIPKNGVSDIAKRMQDELGLFQEIVEHAVSAIVVTNMDGQIVYVNQGFCKQTGYSFEEVRGKNPSILQSGLTHRDVFRELWETLLNNEMWHGNFVNRRKDGELFWEEATIFPVKNNKNESKFYVAIKKNISDIRTLESQLNNEKMLLHAAVNNLQDIFFTFSPTKQILRWNTAANKNLGYTDEEIKIMQPSDYIYKDDLFIYEESLKRLKDREQDKVILRLLHKDGEILPVEFHTSVIKDQNGQVIAFTGTGRDISDKIAVKQERERLFEVAQDLIGIMTMDGTILELNPSWKEILGWDNTELVDKTFLDFIHPNDVLKTKDAMAALQKGKKITGLVNRYLCKDGSYKWLSWNSTPYLQNNIVYAFARDITNEQELQAQLLHTQKMEAIGTLAGGIAHDFNNILGAIVGYAQLIKLYPDAEKNDTYIEQVLIGAERAKELVAQILAFSRKQEFNLDQLKISSLVKEVVKLIKGSVPGNIKIEYNISDMDGIILGDFTQIHQVMMNIVTNAVQAIKSETGTISISLEKCDIKKNNNNLKIPVADGQYVKITIVDSGSGIPENVLNKIFDPFFTTKEKGTGLGLSVVDGIVKNHGGHVLVRSEKEVGSTFELYFPRHNTTCEEKSKPETAIIKGNAKIMIVDDEPSILDISKRILSSAGHSVLTYQNAVDALEFFRDNPDKVDVVISDLMMPDLKGSDLLKVVKKMNESVVVALMTGFNEAEEMEKMRGLGINEIINKPFTAQELTKTIANLTMK